MHSGQYFKETLFHFKCCECDMYWTIGDADKATPVERRQWYCPWCGRLQDMTEGEVQLMSINARLQAGVITKEEILEIINKLPDNSLLRISRNMLLVTLRGDGNYLKSIDEAIKQNVT